MAEPSPPKTSFLKSIPKTVMVLGIASLFTDIASEGTYSVLPLFLTQVLGAGALSLGIIEGVAESTASVLKVFSGFWADRLPTRKPLLLTGYGLSGLIRPLIGLAATWPFVLLFRFVDRVGKGLRGSPRDALIADVTTPANHGASYGFHSAMDDAGALIGPLLAGALLLFTHLGLRNIILLSVIPGIIAWAVLFTIREKPVKTKNEIKKWAPILDWKKFEGGYRRLLLAVFIFTLGNSTDAFLLIRLSQVGVSVGWIPLLWGLHSGVRMVSSLYGGPLSDHLGRKPVIVSGWLYYALIYLAFALVNQKEWVIAIFLAYGIFYGLCEPSEKAFVADMTPKNLKGTAFGYYNLVIGLSALPASLLFGFVGQTWGYPWAFAVGASLAGLASILLLFTKNQNQTSAN
jgi:MFS family permease